MILLFFRPEHNRQRGNGEEFQASFVWRDASGWTDGNDRVGVTLYTTSNDLIDGPRTEIQTLLSPTSTLDNTYEQAPLIFAPVPVAANGKNLMARFPITGTTRRIKPGLAPAIGPTVYRTGK